MGDALEVLVGPQAKGLSASTVARLKLQWADEYDTWCKQPLGNKRWVYLWVDGIHSGVRAEDAKLCALTVITQGDQMIVFYLLAVRFLGT